MARIAAGGLDAEISTQETDEIADMASALGILRDSRRDVQRQAEQASDERYRTSKERRQELLALVSRLQ